MELDFKADDFRSHQCPPLGDNPRTYDRVAEFVNLRIKERLAQAKTVYSHSGKCWLDAPEGISAHYTAKLVDIKGCG